ncbi:MAG: hypothetical protein HY888_04190 [Deltaproteobacteria bacterium]|nr:hypothetical protein [Deltaproteobacteria bacterium]
MAIKAVEMVRKIRDENYERNHSLSREEQLRLIHEEAALFLVKLEQKKKSPSMQRKKVLITPSVTAAR